MYQSYLVCVANTGNKHYHGIIIQLLYNYYTFLSMNFIVLNCSSLGSYSLSSIFGFKVQPA